MARSKKMTEGKREPAWPKWLFGLTILTLVLFGAVTVAFLVYTARAQEQREAFEVMTANYEAEIETLKKELIVKQVVKEKVSTPVVHQNCTKNPFGIKICVPETRIVQREVARTIEVENPEAKARLDRAYAELEALSQKTKSTVLKTEDLDKAVQLIRMLMAPLLSLIVSIAALGIILSKKYSAESEKWAYGSIGTILGFWLS